MIPPHKILSRIRAILLPDGSSGPLSQNQRGLIWHWVILVAAAELLMLAFNKDLALIYGVIAVLFSGGFCLRVCRLYPGKEEPLILDAAAVVISVLFAHWARALENSNARFALIVISSLIIWPHIIYILQKEDI